MKCCKKCYSTYTEKDYPAHTVYDACINQTCLCHSSPELKGECDCMNLYICIFCHQPINVRIQPWDYTFPSRTYHVGCKTSAEHKEISTAKEDAFKKGYAKGVQIQIDFDYLSEEEQKKLLL